MKQVTAATGPWVASGEEHYSQNVKHRGSNGGCMRTAYTHSSRVGQEGRTVGKMY